MQQAAVRRVRHYYTTQRRIDYQLPHRDTCKEQTNQKKMGIASSAFVCTHAYNSYLHIRALKTRVISFLKHYKIVIFHTESTIYTNIFNHCENVLIIEETYFIGICIKKITILDG